jgi:hypothetical protein
MHLNASRWVAYLGCEASAEVLLPRKGNLGDGFQHRALARGLITTDYKLRQLHNAAETGATELVYNVHDLALIGGLERLQ